MLGYFMEINYWAVLVAGLAGFGFAGLWYSPVLFAKPWMAENGFSEKDLSDPKPAMFKSVIFQYCTGLWYRGNFPSGQGWWANELAGRGLLGFFSWRS